MILKNKIAIITGGAGGIGSVIVKKFLAEGATVIVLDRLPSAVPGVKSYPIDIADYASTRKVIGRILKKYQRIDILVNCAGIQAPIGPFIENRFADWEKNIRVNLLGTAALSSMVLPSMVKRKSGVIVNFAGGGATSSRPNLSAYAVAKTGVVRFTEVIADEVKKYGVRVNAVSPGAVNTAMTYEVLRVGKKAGAKELADVKNRLKNGGTPPELVADLVIFLASDKSRELTGKLISAVWDKWRKWDKAAIKKIMESDKYTLRRIK
jgi:NAD(P)-dependent dehydrogenase (short-subunit alcohol dehydrogenase family)